MIWSADPQVTRNAGDICVHLARSFRPGLDSLLAGLPSDPPPPTSADLRRAAGLLSRMTGYLDESAELLRRSAARTDRPPSRA